MKKTLKKGFTIVELVIVIAVVAILAAVLIPTFVSVTKKANESKDTQLVRNLNTALAVDTEVGKHATMQSALEAAEKAGYDVAKINASATDNEILWDSVNDCFAYLKDGNVEYIPNSVNDGEKGSGAELWRIVRSADKMSSDYSNYIASNDISGTIDITTGFDAGKNTAITAVNYTNNNGQKVTIRTNGGALEINAKDGSVNHYGNSSVVTINEVAKNSYHEYGTIGEIKLAKGRVVVEKEASVGSVFVTAASIDDIKVENNGVVGGVAAKDNNVAGSLKNNVDGVNEDKIITSKVPSEIKYSWFAGGLGTESAPFLIEDGKQFKKIGNINGSENKLKYVKLINDIDLTNDIPQNGLYYAGFTGINFDGCGKNVILGTDYSVAGNTENSIIKNCEFIFSSSKSNDQTISQYTSKTVFENIITSGKLSMNGNGGIFGIKVKNNITLNNCINNADIVSSGDYDAVFLGWTSDNNVDNVFTFNNCINKGNMTASRASLFLANGSGSKTLKLIINNCKNEGTIRGTATTVPNGQDKYTQNQYITMPGSNNCEIVVDGNKINSISEGFMMGFVQGPNDTKLSITENEDKTFTITESDNTEVAYYIIKIGLSMVGEGMSSGTEQYYLQEKIIDNNSGNYVSSLKHYDFAKVCEQKGETVCGYETAIVGGNTYYYIVNKKGTGGASLTLTADTQKVTQIILQAYLADGTLVSSTTL